jgi:putative transposase
MPEYRRMDAPGGTFFLTWVTHDRRPLLQSAGNVKRLRAAVAEVKQQHPFEVSAAVILPDHVHFLWELPPGDSDFSKRVGMIKVAFTRALGLTARDGVTRSKSRQHHREASVWQRRF